VAAFVALSVVSAAGAANIKGVTPVPGGSLENVTPAITPLGLSNALTTFVVQLAGDPVTVADANSQDNGHGPLSPGQWQSLRDQLKAQQAPVAQQVQQFGGKVIAQFQSAYNGLAVQIPASKASSLESIPGVTGVFRSLNYTPSNIHGIPLIGAPAVWGGTPGFTGKGIKIADIDTGIDYTHADFGGSGIVSDYTTALASDTLPVANPAWFGPLAPKVKGGIDLVGDSYDASSLTAADQVPQPDPNPLDCNGHGTHTAGTAAGFGVLANGQTYGAPLYSSPYNASMDPGPPGFWNVGPGAAPQADLYAVKVFGCSGSVSDAVLIEAMEWAVINHMDVINMSLGAPFGNASTPSAVAATNAARDGVIVVSASGNEGPAPYMTSSPGSAQGTLSVAANDPIQTFSGAQLATSSGTALLTHSNNADYTDGLTAPIYLMPADPTSALDGPTDTGSIGLGCDPADYAGAAGKIVIAQRGQAADPTCGRVQRAIFAENASAVAAVLVNNAPGYPPIEGDIPNPTTHMNVQIPFFGALSSDTSTFVAADGTSGRLTHQASVPNPLFEALASFSSAGPRSGDSALKPNVTAPGVSIASAGMGTGTGAVTESGTSMATPHTTGTAALVKQADPGWRKVAYWNAAIANTATPSLVAGYNTLGAGSGFIQAFNATHTQVVALGGQNSTSLDFGLYASDRDFSGNANVQLHNFGSSPATFTVADALDQGSPHTISVNPATATVPPHGDRYVQVNLNVPIATAGDAYSFNSVAGLITFTPVSAGNNSGIALSVPYLLVPQASSDLRVSSFNLGNFNVKPARPHTPPPTTATATATLTNNHGAALGVADWFAWGLRDRHDHQLASDDLLAAGIQSYPSYGFALFAIDVAHRWSNPSEDEFDTYVDVNGDSVPDYDVVAADLGALTTGTFNGEDAVAVAPVNPDLTPAGGFSIRYLAGANFNGSTMEVPVDFSQLCRPGFACISSTKPISYTTVAFGLTDGTFDTFNTSASYNLFQPVFSNNDEDVVAPNTTATDPTTIDLTQWAAAPQLGLLVLSQNNVTHSNNNEAITIPVNIHH
jgi:subtilisin family serine protease